MIYALVLGAHLTAAAITAVIVFYSLYAIAWNKSERYRACMVAIASIALFEVLSGTLLAVVAPSVSPTILGAHIAEYLSICLAVGTLLYIKESAVVAYAR